MKRSAILVSVSTLGAALVLVPLYWMGVTAIRTPEAVLAFPPSLLPGSITGENFRNLFATTQFPTYVWNSFIVAVCVVLVVDVAAFLGAYAISRYPSKFTSAAALLALMSYMIAPIMIVIPFYISLRAIGLINTQFGLILAHISFCLPFALWLMKSYIDEVPIELERAALVDGAPLSAVLTSVVLPVVRPGLAAVSIFTFILSWNDYVFARILLSSDGVKTIPVGLEDIYTATVTDWGMLMAAGVASTVPILIGFVFVHRAFVRGWGHSGLKG